MTTSTNSKKDLKEFRGKLMTSLVDDEVQRVLVQALSSSLSKSMMNNTAFIESVAKKAQQRIIQQQEEDSVALARISEVPIPSAEAQSLVINPAVTKAFVSQQMSTAFPPIHDASQNSRETDVEVMIPWYQQNSTTWHNLTTSSYDLGLRLAIQAALASQEWQTLILTQMDLGGYQVTSLTQEIVHTYLKTHHHTRSMLMEKFSAAYQTVRSNLQCKDRMALHRKKMSKVKVEKQENLPQTTNTVTEVKAPELATAQTSTSSSSESSPPPPPSPSPSPKAQSYEEMRQQKILDNNKKLEELGLLPRQSPGSDKETDDENSKPKRRRTVPANQTAQREKSKRATTTTKPGASKPKSVTVSKSVAASNSTVPAAASSFY